MPTRILRPGILTSERFNSLPWDTQLFFYKLLSLVDDYGRFYGSMKLLGSQAYPLGDPAGNVLQMQAIASMCTHLLANDFIRIYEVEGKKYLQILQWKEVPRAKTSRFPAMPADASKRKQMQVDESNCKQMQADASKCSASSDSDSDSDSDSLLASTRVRAPAREPPSEVGEVSEKVLYDEAERDLRFIALEVYDRRITTWNTEWSRYIGQVVPVDREHWRRFKWLYWLPRDHPILNDPAAPGKTQRKATFTGLLQCLEPEVEKAWDSWERKKAGEKREDEEFAEGSLGMQPV